MILKPVVVQKIVETDLSLELAKEMGFTQYWITQLAKKNKDNGPLTSAGALNVIREELGITDSEILEEEAEPAVK